MDRWPQELFDHVVLFAEQRVGEDTVPAWEHRLLPPARPILAAVSRKFQAAVEHLTFKELRVKASDSGLDDLARILNVRRRQSLRRLSVTLVLPPLCIDGFREFWWMTDEDRRANNNAATALLRRLFDILNQNPAAPAIELEIARAEPTPDARQKEQELHPNFSMLKLTNEVVDFPTLPFVRKLVFDASRWEERVWSPTAVATLTSLMPNVQEVVWNLEKEWGRYYSLDQMYRDELVSGIRSARMPKSVKDFTLTMTPSHFWNRSLALPAFHDEATPDIVGIYLRELVKNCQRIKIYGQLGTSFFDASTATEPDQLPWKHATVLEVEVSMNGPDGSWLFDCQQVGDSTDQQPLVSAAQHRLPPGYAATEEEEWEAEDFYDENKDFLEADKDCSGSESESFSRRSMPNDKNMNALLNALARRCSRSLAPSLERAIFSVEYDADENWPFQVCFGAPGTAFFWDGEHGHDLNVWRVYLHVDRWRPSQDTLDAFRAIGRDDNGRESIITFLSFGDFWD